MGLETYTEGECISKAKFLSRVIISIHLKKKQLISIKKPTKTPNHKILTTNTTKKYIFKSHISNPPF